MRLQVQKSFRCSPSLVWLHLCEPERMSQWSGFRISEVSPGQSGHPGGPGAHRRVYLPFAGRIVVVNEVIRDAEPPHRLTYQVVDTLAMRSHLGQIYLEKTEQGCDLRWEVEFEFIVPIANSLVAKELKSQLSRALDVLVKSLDGADDAETSLPSWPAIAPPSDEDWQRAAATLTDLQALALDLDRKNDPKRIFAHIYSYVSEGILQGCRDGRFIYPAWALRLLPVFHDYYWSNFQRWTGSARGEVESHWRRAFAAAEKKASPSRDPLSVGLVLAIHAHVESDLPRTLAQVYVDHFAEVADYDRFRGDYYAMGHIFMESARRIQALMPEDSVPLWAKALGRFMPQEITQQVIYKKAYNLPKQRRAAFRRGAELANMLLARQSHPASRA
jgi:uncharacterized protein YndB with AHSA1/START domain